MRHESQHAARYQIRKLGFLPQLNLRILTEKKTGLETSPTRGYYGAEIYNRTTWRS